jgi:hypothetical protein
VRERSEKKDSHPLRRCGGRACDCFYDRWGLQNTITTTKPLISNKLG